ncbi:MAG: 50S ribosomal protein L21 [Candidatus Omnitrophota bacterium]
MYAIIETGSKQYKVQKGDVFEVESLEVEKGAEIALDKVLFYAQGTSYEIGTPHIAGAKVLCDVVRHMRGEKTIAFTYRRRKNSRKKTGHRQELTQLKVKEIAVA